MLGGPLYDDVVYLNEGSRYAEIAHTQRPWAFAREAVQRPLHSPLEPRPWRSSQIHAAVRALRARLSFWADHPPSALAVTRARLPLSSKASTGPDDHEARLLHLFRLELPRAWPRDD